MHRMKLAVVLCLVALFITYAGQAQSGANHPTKPLQKRVLPPGALPLTYNGHFYFDAVLADSLSMRLVFDTGADGFYFGLDRDGVL